MPDVPIQIPAPLRPLAGDVAEVRVEAATPAEAMEALVGRRPRLRERLYREDGRLRPNVNVYVDGRELRGLEADETLDERTTITIVPSIAGGRGSGTDRLRGGGEPPGRDPGVGTPRRSRPVDLLTVPRPGRRVPPSSIRDPVPSAMEET